MTSAVPTDSKTQTVLTKLRKWPQVQLRRVCRMRYGDSLAGQERDNGDVIVYGSNGPVGEHSVANMKAPSIVVGRKGSFGRVVYAPDGGFAIDTTFFISSEDTLHNVRWLFFALQTLELDTVSQDTGVPGLSRESAYERRIALPPLPTQKAIANFLDRKTAAIDALIEKKEKLLELLGEKRSALINRAVTKGLDPNVPMKDSGIPWIGEIPEHWELRRLKDLAHKISDIDHKMPKAVEAGVPFLSAKDLLDDLTLNFERDVKQISEEDFQHLSRKIAPQFGDIIYSRIGAKLGKARLVESHKRFLVSYSCCTIRPRKDLCIPSFLRFVLDSGFVLVEARLRTQGIGVPDLGLAEIGRFLIPNPPLEEQLALATYLESVLNHYGRLLKKAESSLERLREYRQSLITAAVTGQLEIPIEPSARQDDE